MCLVAEGLPSVLAAPARVDILLRKLRRLDFPFLGYLAVIYRLVLVALVVLDGNVHDGGVNDAAALGEQTLSIFLNVSSLVFVSMSISR